MLPAPSNYNVGAGKPVSAGRAARPNAVLDLIAAAPSNSWTQINLNTFTSVFAHPDFTPTPNVSNQNAILNAWSSFAWDSKRSQIILWGGGHANYSGNDVYVFDFFTQQWKLAFYPSAIRDLGTGVGWEPIDGAEVAPMSSHTYANNNYLPTLDRFITFGGAAFQSGGIFKVGSPARSVAGGYTLDMTLAGLGFVGGTDGSNPKRNTTLGINLAGAKAWTIRDYAKPGAINASWQAVGSPVGRTNAGGDVSFENGRDVIYYTSAGQTSPDLFRVEYFSANDPSQDVITKMGGFWTNAGTPSGVAYDRAKKVFAYFYDSTNPICFWDLNGVLGSSNHNVLLPAGNITGTGAAGISTAAFSNTASVTPTRWLL